jgi:hypothetical protein
MTTVTTTSIGSTHANFFGGASRCLTREFFENTNFHRRVIGFFHQKDKELFFIFLIFISNIIHGFKEIFDRPQLLPHSFPHFCLSLPAA